MIQNVQELYITLRTTEPITVMCSSGVGRTGVFIALGIVLERYSVEGMIDLFQTVKTLRIQRSAMVQTREQYHFCYEAILDYLLNTGQLPRIRSVSVDSRSSVYCTTATPASSPPSQGNGGLTTSTVEMASALKIRQMMTMGHCYLLLTKRVLFSYYYHNIIILLLLFLLFYYFLLFS
ncbi:PREDICTED: tyrosine-protein phosphatase non-receptor type ptp-2-like [Amphimedon queenslandica]|uniref:Tyrosine-protein phosphatase domain-containing protein n=1 Tax=Amphimedon queenslandica TaxID=400682 RepID=A0AAN0JE60_AMPQE|nr:PREDICTED: tyrosine-protein phosphatase non-receptor type ptp-2-like [Amphimedon queenslandica]|eukprot:XP_019855279.1 PREDICTED: tyrosine-protein phosphatase non-receptor type ptp-2-like [Amphimedon queenslandica]